MSDYLNSHAFTKAPREDCVYLTLCVCKILILSCLPPRPHFLSLSVPSSLHSHPGRRGSPLLIGVRSEHELLTENIPIQYNSGELCSSLCLCHYPLTQHPKSLHKCTLTPGGIVRTYSQRSVHLRVDLTAC